MPGSYLRRNDVGYPQRPNARGIYGVKHFEDADPDTLQDVVNVYLLELPTANPRWSPHILDVQFTYTGAGGNARHHAWITIFAAGTIATPPTG
jgi:hypothetical protein